MAIPHQTGRCASGELSIFYRKMGPASFMGSESNVSQSERLYSDPILLAHGLSYFSFDWLEVAAALASERACVAVDLRGFGDSGWSATGDYSVAAMAQDLACVLDHLRWKRAVLVGHSMGGRCAAYLAAKEPQRAAGLVLVDYSPENAPAGSRRVAQTVAAVPEVFPSVDEAMRHFGADPADASRRERFEAYLRKVAGGYAIKRDSFFRDQFRRILETGERPKLGVDMWQVLAEVTCPTLVVRASRSDLFAAETVAKVKSANPRFTVLEVDASHNIPGDNPRGLLAALAPFLAGLQEKRHEHAA